MRAAELEREDRLQILPFQEHALSKPAAQARRLLQWAFRGDVVDARLQDALEIAGGRRHVRILACVT